jgi:hypothetical protein
LHADDGVNFMPGQGTRQLARHDSQEWP